MATLAEKAQRAAAALTLQPTVAGTLETPTGKLPFHPNQPPADTPTPPGLLAGLQRGLMNDPSSMIPKLAKQRFPQLSAEEAQGRYGMANGRIIYIDDAGKLFYEFPDEILPGATELGQIASQEGPPAVGGTVGGLLGGLPGAALGGVVGEGMRRAGGALAGEDQTLLGNIKDMALQGLVEGGSFGLGKLWTDKVTKAGLARDINRFTDPNQPFAQRAAKRSAVAQREGISVTPAEQTGLPSLIGEQRVLEKTHGPAGDIMGEFMGRRPGEVKTAVMANLPPSGRPAESVMGDLRGAAISVIDKAKEARANAAEPFYSAAWADPTPVDIRPALAALDKNLKVAVGKRAGALRKVKNWLTKPIEQTKLNKNGKQVKEIVRVPETDISRLHSAKTEIDDLLDITGDNAVKNTTRRNLMEVKEALLEQMGIANPQYEQARATFAANSPPVDELRNGVIGAIAQTKDDKLMRAAHPLFDINVSASQIRNARTKISATNPEIWDEAVRVKLIQMWSELETKTGINLAGKYRRAVIARAKDGGKLRELLGDRYARFNALLDVFDGMDAVAGNQSITAFAQESLKTMQMKGVESNALTNLLDTTLTALKPFQWQTILREMSGERYMERMAHVITSDNALAVLPSLMKLPKRSEAARQVMVQALGRAGYHTVGDFLGMNRGPENEAPQAMQR
jgi:hypothetical protein